MKNCVICNKEFDSFHSATTVCSIACRKERTAKYKKKWQEKNKSRNKLVRDKKEYKKRSNVSFSVSEIPSINEARKEAGLKPLQRENKKKIKKKKKEHKTYYVSLKDLEALQSAVNK